MRKRHFIFLALSMAVRPLYAEVDPATWKEAYDQVLTTINKEHEVVLSNNSRVREFCREGKLTTLLPGSKINMLLEEKTVAEATAVYTRCTTAFRASDSQPWPIKGGGKMKIKDLNKL